MALVSTFALSPDVAVGTTNSRVRVGVAGPAPSALEPTSSGWSSWSCLAAGAIVGAAAAGRVKTTRRRAGAEKQASTSEVVARSDLFRGIGAAVATMPLAPAPAAAKSRDEAAAQLKTYGVPEIAPKEDAPGGWKIVVEPIGLVDDANYGRFKLGAEPQVVVFNVPPLWIVSVPNIDFNGAAGTVQANDYGKGDSATLFVDTKFQGNFDEMKKKDFQVAMKKALTMKGKNFIEGLRVSKITDGAPGYKIIEYDYEIESAAGFSINRQGLASVTQQGKNGLLQIFWTATTQPRWSDMEGALKDIVKSFRIASVPDNVTIPRKNIQRQDELEARQIGV